MREVRNTNLTMKICGEAIKSLSTFCGLPIRDDEKDLLISKLISFEQIDKDF